jgi:hypothetical protein
MRLVIIESPWAGDLRKNRNYARKAVRDSLLRGESPIASHLLYTQAGVLKDAVPDERALGIAAGLAWAEVADAQIFYADYGFSIGMLHALKEASKAGVPVEVRYLFKRVAGTRAQRKGKRSGAVIDAQSGESPHAIPVDGRDIGQNKS